MAARADTERPIDTSEEVTQALARLADLRDRGAITPEEYEAKKAGAAEPPVIQGRPPP